MSMTSTHALYSNVLGRNFATEYTDVMLGHNVEYRDRISRPLIVVL